jgi:hypothetical protein
MQVIDTIRAAQGGAAIDHLARAFNIEPEQADAIVEAVLPQLAQALERNTLSRGGLADLVQALGQGHHEGYLDNPRALSDPSTISDGNAILGHILGDRDRSRGVAAQASRIAGVPEGLIKMLLPILATWLMGALSKQVKGGFGDILGRMGGGAESPGGGDMGMPRMPEMPGGGAGLPMPDMGGGGGGGWSIPRSGGDRSGWPQGHGGGLNLPGGSGSGGSGSGGGMGLPMPDMRGGAGLPMPDMRGGAGLPMPDMGGGESGGRGGRSGSPLPLPGDSMPNFPGRGNNPYGDLSDILRRGGQIQLPGGGGSAGGGVLWSIVRNILGGALGFGSGGVMSWLFRMIFVRFGWGLLKTILGRALLGR